MTILFISDLHLEAERPDISKQFLHFLETEASEAEELYILGDLFEYWIGDDGSEVLGHRSVEQALKHTVDKGTEVFFLHGNRDFLIGEAFADRTGCQLLTDPVIIEPDGQKILLTHGDALCTDDLEHQQARHQMLSSKWKMAFLQQSIEDRRQAAGALRAKSESGKQNKPMEIMDVNQQAVEKMMRTHGVEVMIHGHTHRPAVHEFLLDGELARRYVLGDWYTQKSAIFYNDGKLTLRK